MTAELDVGSLGKINIISPSCPRPNDAFIVQRVT